MSPPSPAPPSYPPSRRATRPREVIFRRRKIVAESRAIAEACATFASLSPLPTRRQRLLNLPPPPPLSLPAPPPSEPETSATAPCPAIPGPSSRDPRPGATSAPPKLPRRPAEPAPTVRATAASKARAAATAKDAAAARPVAIRTPAPRISVTPPKPAAPAAPRTPPPPQKAVRRPPPPASPTHLAAPQPRARIRSPTPPTARPPVWSMPSLDVPTPMDTTAAVSPSYAAAAATSPPKPAPRASASPPPPPAAASAPVKQPRYPPLVVENLPDWTRHFKALRTSLGHTPNARPFGKGVRFLPKSDQEYRTIQRYLTELEKSAGISWFSYSLPAERSLKVAIRGLPVNTDPEAIKEELQERGYSVEYVRPIHARHGRPGCIFFAQVERTPNPIPGIYEVCELLGMPGVRIEAWRGKRGPAQCHRCQQFRHSSHQCHRRPACVRCGEEHAARDCPRPLEDLPTCANCHGAHTANNAECPVFRKETRNKRAGTTARTAAEPPPRVDAGEENAAGSLMAAANNPDAPKPPRRRRRKRGNNNKKKTATPEEQPQAQRAQQPAPAAPGASLAAVAAPTQGKKAKRERAPVETQDGKDEVLTKAIKVLQGVLVAIQEGRDPVPIILRGMADLYA